MKHCGTQELETQRLVLRRLSMDDSEMMYNNWASDKQVTQYLRWNAHRSWGETAETLNEWETGTPACCSARSAFSPRRRSRPAGT